MSAALVRLAGVASGWGGGSNGIKSASNIFRIAINSLPFLLKLYSKGIEQVDFIRNINYERGNQITAELRQRGWLMSTTGVPAEMLDNITTAAGGDAQSDITAR